MIDASARREERHKRRRNRKTAFSREGVKVSGDARVRLRAPGARNAKFITPRGNASDSRENEANNGQDKEVLV